MGKDLRDRWEDLWQKLDVRTAPQSTFDELIEAYASPDRFYHTFVHIEDCLSIFDQAKSLAVHPEEVELALWFHDAVYDPKRSDNEQKSAEWAEGVIKQSGGSNDSAERVSYSILATRHQQEVTGADAQLMVDVDLSILGREPDIFWSYEENIRKEYSWVPEELFRRKRMEILSRFLEHQHIYYHRQYREMFEEKARANLKRAIARLMDAA